MAAGRAEIKRNPVARSGDRQIVSEPVPLAPLC